MNPLIFQALYFTVLLSQEPTEDSLPVENKNEENKNEDQKISKTEKRRRKKEAEEKAKQERIKAALKESEEKFLRGELSPKMVEQNSIQECSRSSFLSTQNRARVLPSVYLKSYIYRL